MTSTSAVVGVSPTTTISRGGDRRNSATAHSLRRGLLLRAPGSELRRAVVVAGAAVARINGGDRNGGGRSSGVDGLDATVRGMASGLQLRALWVLTNPLDTVV